VPEDDIARPSASEFKDLTSGVWSCQCRKFANARGIVQYTRFELPTGPCRSPNRFSGSVDAIGRQALRSIPS
jgi:hypothetical protein